MVIRHLLKTVYLENGELLAFVGGSRFLLARCRPRAEVYEHISQFMTAGGQSYERKEYRVVFAICGGAEFTRPADDSFIQTVERFELEADRWKKDGVLERIRFGSMRLVEINARNEWAFEVINALSVAEKLMEKSSE